MALDKFISRGFTSSVGSGEGRWVQTSSSPTQTTSADKFAGNHQQGTSFVMGGGGLRGRPAASRDKAGGSASYTEERYSFDAHDVRHQGTGRGSKHARESKEESSLNDWMNSTRGHRVVLGIGCYLIAMFALIFLIVSAWSGGERESLYSSPAGVSRKVRPMWER
jgi:hypothetical protein